MDGTCMRDEEGFRTARERRFYHRLRGKVKRWAGRRQVRGRRLEYVLAAPDLFVLLSRLSVDERVPLRTKAKVAAGVAYFVTPLDIIPDFLGPPGYLDDVVVAAWILRSVVAQLNELDPTIVEEHWEGEADILEQVTRIVDGAEFVVERCLRFVVGRVRSREEEAVGG